MWPCPRLSQPFARPSASTASPRVAPLRVICGPWAAMCVTDSAGCCTTLEVQRLDAAIEGPSATLASSFKVEILSLVSPSEAGPVSAEGGNDAERASHYDVDLERVSDLYNAEGIALKDKTEKAQKSWAQKEQNFQYEVAQLQEKYQKGLSPPTTRNPHRRTSSAA